MTGDGPATSGASDASAGSLVVRRRILPWRPRWRGPRFDFGGGSTDGGDSGDGDLDAPVGGGFGLGDLLDDLVAAVLVVVVAAVVVTTLVPAIVLALEVVLVLLAAAVVLTSRLVFRHPWPVEARSTSTGEVVARWQVVGWRRAGRARDSIRQMIAFGADLPPPGPWDPDDPSPRS